jgi:putative dimethyl sulfoxide reductase chaperone
MNEESRAACYILLAQGLAYPHPTFVDEFRQLLDVFSTVEGSETLENQLAELAAGLDGAETLPLDNLQGEHTGLFVNNHPHVPCPPYESAYREKTLMGNATASAAHTYRQWGLEVDKEFADYAGAELEFMAFVIRMSEQSETLQAQQGFLTNHLLTWMPKFAADIQHAAKLDIYRALGKMLGVFLAMEEETLVVEAAPKASMSAKLLRPLPGT